MKGPEIISSLIERDAEPEKIARAVLAQADIVHIARQTVVEAQQKADEEEKKLEEMYTALPWDAFENLKQEERNTIIRAWPQRELD